ncbi:GRAM domain-containing protein 2A isoform X1 [Anoplophora glabripennis]|uniref:GRAM domain-containing protein 2A isoform X1 n=1 Tax=Anoplophora glabripennis TaxID=217634 RepID=UPI000873DB21|nr:GRAM domain-containing protein 2A isoform X1 [Anoplophora glabripennis]
MVRECFCVYKPAKKVYLIAKAFSMSVQNDKRINKISPLAKKAGISGKNGKEYSSNSDNESSSTGSGESIISNVKKEATDPNDTPSTVKVKRLSKSLRKKFFHHFPNIEDDEEVLGRYACALQSEILLQGYLYITTNYFGFYSNVFGFVTKLLIPILTVQDITREKTARIFNNAIGIVTSEQKHVFASFISRDSALEYMRSVWEKAKSEAELLEKEISAQGLDYNELEEEDEVDHGETSDPEKTHLKGSRKASIALTKAPRTIRYFKKKQQRIILLATIALLVTLYTSASLLLYRISQMQNKYSIALEDVKNSDSPSVYRDILELQTELHSKSDGAVFDYLDSNLNQIAKVKKSLETLSSLLLDTSHSNAEYNSRQQEPAKS